MVPPGVGVIAGEWSDDPLSHGAGPYIIIAILRRLRM